MTNSKAYLLPGHCRPATTPTHPSHWGIVKGSIYVSWRKLRPLGNSCGRSELPWRDADEAPKVMREMTLVREAGLRSDLRDGAVRFSQHEFFSAFDAAHDDILMWGQPGGPL